MDWEAWLRRAAQRPSDNEDSKRDRTEREVRAALDDWPALQGRPWKVYVKGSYANNTNVRLNFDVDVAVEYYGHFYYDLDFDLRGHDPSEVDVVPANDQYKRGQFKKDVLDALSERFGASAVTAGRIAYRVREGKTTLPADVVPCWEYRRYDRLDPRGEPVFATGSRVFPSDGGHVNNFPNVQLENGIAKNNRTGRRYKRMVRGFKKLQSELSRNGLVDSELPSYLSECLVYNVPDDLFQNGTYLADMRQVLATVFNETLPAGGSHEWHEVHELMYLFRGSRSWTVRQVHDMAGKAWDHMGFD